MSTKYKDSDGKTVTDKYLTWADSGVTKPTTITSSNFLDTDADLSNTIVALPDFVKVANYESKLTAAGLAAINPYKP